AGVVRIGRISNRSTDMPRRAHCHAASVPASPAPIIRIRVNLSPVVYYRCAQQGRTQMARISLIESDKASPEVKEIYEGKLKGKPGSVQKALAHRPAMLGNFLTFYASVGRSLDRKLYEAVYLRTSLINGCRYC